jgi:hypothetical protein
MATMRTPQVANRPRPKPFPVLQALRMEVAIRITRPLGVILPLLQAL